MLRWLSENLEEAIKYSRYYFVASFILFIALGKVENGGVVENL